MSEVAEINRVANGSEVPIWPRLDRRAMRVMARARLYSELRLLVLDLLGPYDPGELPVEVSAWVESTAARAASAVGDASMSALIRSLESTLAGAPADIIQRLDQAAVRHDVRID